MDGKTDLTGKMAAEFVGTLALIYVGVLVLTSGSESGLVGAALAHGLTIAVMASATMAVSGGHLNPAVTLGALVGRRISIQDALAYVVAQLAGGMLGAFLARRSLPGGDIAGGLPGLGPGMTTGSAILVEAVLTFFLMFVIFGTAIDNRFGGRIGGLGIGFAVAIGVFAGGPLTGAAMNPARWFGPALVTQTWEDAAVYLAGPALGAVLATLVYTSFIM
ncbi:MAG TPA: aquaporin, partial [Candidatus Thermoplasmatota archaeon]|nr:aquaporin [Candidatus Thermoplasmatota archaeon]